MSQRKWSLWATGGSLLVLALVALLGYLWGSSVELVVLAGVALLSGVGFLIVHTRAVEREERSRDTYAEIQKAATELVQREYGGDPAKQAEVLDQLQSFLAYLQQGAEGAGDDPQP